MYLKLMLCLPSFDLYTSASKAARQQSLLAMHPDVQSPSFLAPVTLLIAFDVFSFDSLLLLPSASVVVLCFTSFHHSAYIPTEPCPSYVAPESERLLLAGIVITALVQPAYTRGYFIKVLSSSKRSLLLKQNLNLRMTQFKPAKADMLPCHHSSPCKYNNVNSLWLQSSLLNKGCLLH